MRRLTRRIGLFGGPGAIVKAAGAGKGKPSPAASDPKPDTPAAGGASPRSCGSWRKASSLACAFATSRRDMT